MSDQGASYSSSSSSSSSAAPGRGAKRRRLAGPAAIGVGGHQAAGAAPPRVPPKRAPRNVDNVPRKVYAVGGDGKTSTVVLDATRRPPPPAAAGGGAGAGAGPAYWSAAEVPALPAGVSFAAAAWLGAGCAGQCG